MTKLVVAHQYGARSHYLGLEEYCKRNNIPIVWLELDLIRQFVLCVLFRKPFSKLYGNVKEILLLILRVHRRDTVVIGIAPFSIYALYIPLLRSKRIFLHTSWPFWRSNFVPYKGKFMAKIWDYIIPKYVNGVFCVTKACKSSFIDRYPKFKDSAYVVYHSIENIWFEDFEKEERVYDFVFVGRMIAEKGVNEILTLAKILSDKKFAMVGDGPDLEDLKRRSPGNITFLGRLDRAYLRKVYVRSNCLLLPSKKSKNWVEAFGIVLLEASACGCNIITTKHPGPIELSEIFANIYLVNEADFVQGALKVCQSEFVSISQNELIALFDTKNISSKWELGLNAYD